MTTELEKEFFKVFGIEPKWKDKRVKNSKTYYTKEQADYLRVTTKNRNIQLCYPEITAEILLELVYIIGVKPYGFLYINDTYSTNINSRTDIILVEADDFKEGVLTLAIQPRVALRIKREVRALFGGEE